MLLFSWVAENRVSRTDSLALAAELDIVRPQKENTVSNVRVTFLGCLQDSQELGSSNEHMVSRLFFNIEVNGREYTGFHCNVKQIVGATFEGEAPLEVGPPAGARYRGPFNHEAFRAEAEAYFRELVGSQGQAIRVGPGATLIHMRNNRFNRTKAVEFPVSGPDCAW